MNSFLARALKNWKTTLCGLCAFLSACPGFISSLLAWQKHQPVDWRSVFVSIALTAIGIGLAHAKDSDQHSTEAEVFQATTEAKANGK